MKKWLNKIALWVLVKTGGIHDIVLSISKSLNNEPKTVPVYVKRAEEIVKSVDSLQTSGEYKRHQVYSRLIKEFPEEDKKNLGLAIELGVQKLK